MIWRIKLVQRDPLSVTEQSPVVPPRASKTIDRGGTSPHTTVAGKRLHGIDDTDALLISAEVHASSTGNTDTEDPLPQCPLYRSASNADDPASIANLLEQIRSDTRTLVIADSNGKTVSRC